MRVDSAPDQQHVAQRGERRAPVGSQLREERAPRGRSPSGAGGDSTKLPVRSQRHKGELPIGSGPTCARAGLGQRVGSDRLSEIDFLTGDRKLAVTMWLLLHTSIFRLKLLGLGIGIIDFFCCWNFI